MEFQDPGFCLLHPGMLQAFQSYLAVGRFLRLDVCFLFLCVLNNDISISSSSSSSSNAYLGSPNFQVKIVVLMFLRDIPRKDSFYNCGYFWGLWGFVGVCGGRSHRHLQSLNLCSQSKQSLHSGNRQEPHRRASRSSPLCLPWRRSTLGGLYTFRALEQRLIF